MMDRPIYTMEEAVYVKAGKLKDNMMELDGEMLRMEGLVDFHEAPGYINITESIICHTRIITMKM